MTSWYKSTCDAAGISFLSFSKSALCMLSNFLFCESYLVLSVLPFYKLHIRSVLSFCIKKRESSMSKRYLVDRSKKEGESSSRFRSCAPPCICYIVPGDTHDLCVVCLGAEHARSALEGAVCVHCERLQMHLLRSRKGFHQCFPQCWSRCLRGGAASALLGIASGSVGGNGDGRVPISFPTHQIRWPFTRIGSPLGCYFSPGNGLGASLIFL